MRLSYSALFVVAGLATMVAVGEAQIVTNFTANINQCQVETAPDPCPGGVPNNPGAGGSATLQLTETGVEADNVLTYTVTFSGLSSPTSNAHIHGPAAPGLSAGVVHGFTSNDPAPGNPTHVSPITGSWTFATGLTNARVAQLKQGLFYINIHTVNYPSGEVRGQILIDSVPVSSSTWGRLKTIYR